MYAGFSLFKISQLDDYVFNICIFSWLDDLPSNAPIFCYLCLLINRLVCCLISILLLTIYIKIKQTLASFANQLNFLSLLVALLSCYLQGILWS